jgi:ATP-binding cassette, subfamily B (MDR/TAP), member 1
MRDGKIDEPDGPSADAQRNNWKTIFAFTKGNHVVTLTSAFVFASAAGALGPVMAIFLGKFFDAFAEFGAAKIPPKELMDRAMTSIVGFIGVGIGTVLLKTGLFFCWLSFGEFQAKSVRDELFAGLLKKDLQWFEMRDAGVGTPLARLQTYALSVR